MKAIIAIFLCQNAFSAGLFYLGSVYEMEVFTAIGLLSVCVSIAVYHIMYRELDTESSEEILKSLMQEANVRD